VSIVHAQEPERSCMLGKMLPLKETGDRVISVIYAEIRADWVSYLHANPPTPRLRLTIVRIRADKK